jgi:HlyD family secretion protein
MANSSRSTGIIVVVIILVAGGGGWYYWQSQKDKGPEFYTTTVSRGEIVQTVTAAGTIKPLVDVIVSSQISGYITSWSTDFNAKVSKGQVMATLLPTSYKAAVQSAEGDLANAKANADLQGVTLNRDKTLLDKSLIAQSDYDTQAALVEEANAQIQVKQAALDTAKTNLSYCNIVSPIDGMVISRNIDVGNSVAATLSSPTLFEIGNDLTKMQIDAAVAEADVGNVENGQDVNFTVDAYPNRNFHGTVYQVRNAPQTQQNVVSYDVMIKVDNSDLKLKPGMTANASIVITRHTGVLRLANSALRMRMPDDIKVIQAPEPAPAPGAAADAAPAAPAKTLTPAENRQAMQQIFQEVGFARGTPPTPEMAQKIQDLAKARGVQLSDRMLAMLNGGRSGAPSEAPVFRTVFRVPAGNPPGSTPEALRVRLGITDGANTEIVGDQLKENDVIVTGVNQPVAAAGAASPFGGGNGARIPGGGGGGGGRGF